MKNNLAKIMGERLISITTISLNTGISRPTLTNFYYRRSNTIKLNTLTRLCDYLQVPLSELIEYVPQISESEVK